MSNYIKICIEVELLSDTIFGSGHSTPGGADIALCCDKSGYPYLKGSTLKGLLRESLTNYICWTDGDRDLLRILFGDVDTSDDFSCRRILFSDLTLIDPPKDPSECVVDRTFTSIQNGTAEDGSLRLASCVRKGTKLQGEILCDNQDYQIISDSLKAIRFLGTMRSRGLGSVRFSDTAYNLEYSNRTIEDTSCIYYRLRTESPVIITNLSHSFDNSFDTFGTISGSSIRGYVINSISSDDSAFFASHRHELLSEKCRFTNALPVVGDLPPIPMIMGYYTDKKGEAFQTVVADGTFDSGLKRAKLGSCCGIDGNTLCGWSADTNGYMRINRNTNTADSNLFQTRHISAGQEFEGYILLDNPSLAQHITKAFNGIVTLGADIFEGFGRCSVVDFKPIECPKEIKSYGIQSEDQITRDLYLLALSPITMINDIGEPCGLDMEFLADRLGVKKVEIPYCSTSLIDQSGYNRKWHTQLPALRMYSPGSLFHLKCSEVPSLERIRSIEIKGLGARKSEGCGRVLFLSEDTFKAIKHGVRLKASDSTPSDVLTSTNRRSRYRWIMDNVCMLEGPSKSQLGEIQVLCETAATIGTAENVYSYLNKNLTERGAMHAERFVSINEFIYRILNTDINITLGTENCPDSITDRLHLLCELFDFSRKEIYE